MTQEEIELLITSYVDDELNPAEINDLEKLLEKDKKLKFDYKIQSSIKSIISERLKMNPVPEQIKLKVLKKINPSKNFLDSIFSRILF